MARKDSFAHLKTSARARAVEVANSADVEARSECGETLMFAAAGRPPAKGANVAVELCKLLQSRGLSATYVDDTQETPLFEAVRSENLRSASWLLDQGCSPNAENLDGETPLSLAFYFSQLEMVFLLLSHGGDLDELDSKGLRPVLYANPIFREAFYAARARGGIDPEPAKPAGRKRKQGDREPEHPYKRFKGSAASCKGDVYLRRWVYADEPHGEDGKIYLHQGQVHAEQNGFRVQATPLHAAAKLRTIQRELVQDHANQYPEIILACSPGEWARHIGVKEEEPDAHEQMFDLVQDSHDPDSERFVLSAVDGATDDIVGYIVVNYHPETKLINIAYLKVIAAFQGQGIGRLLLNCGMQAAMDRQWDFKTAKITVNLRNIAALTWYRRLGFNSPDVDQKLRQGNSLGKSFVNLFKQIPTETQAPPAGMAPGV